MPEDYTWNTSEQGNGVNSDIDFQGKRLSLLWDCAVRYPAFDKNVFESIHGMLLAYAFAAGMDDVALISLNKNYLIFRKNGYTVAQSNIKAKEYAQTTSK